MIEVLEPETIKMEEEDMEDIQAMRFLSTQYGNELKALLSLESLDDMKMYAKETGDISSQWKVTCNNEIEVTI